MNSLHPPSDRKAHLLLDGWPIVVLRLENGVSLEEMEPLFERYEREVYGRKEPFISLTDLRGISSVPGADFRKRMGEWSKEGDEAMQAYSQGNVTVFSSKLIRGAVTAIFWIYKPPIPQGVAGGWDEAIAWCTQQLEKGGVIIPSMNELALRKDPFAFSFSAASENSGP